VVQGKAPRAERTLGDHREVIVVVVTAIVASAKREEDRVARDATHGFTG
jgi:hypothetical protein